MSSTEAPTDGHGGPTIGSPLEEVFDRLTDRRRLILDLLLETSGAVPIAELATHVATAEADDGDVATATVDAVHVNLQQFQLPTLSQAGLVEWDREAETVAPTDHPVFEDHRFRHLVAAEVSLEDVVDCLSNDLRRHAVAVLNFADDSVPRDHLVEAVSDRASEPAADVSVSLHHVHLPKLEKMGLLVRESDGDETFVRWTPTEIEASWIDYLLGQ